LTSRFHFLLFIPHDKGCFVAVKAVGSGKVITLSPFRYHGIFLIFARRA
jgi:hypothetical protein